RHSRLSGSLATNCLAQLQVPSIGERPGKACAISRLANVCRRSWKRIVGWLGEACPTLCRLETQVFRHVRTDRAVDGQVSARPLTGIRVRMRFRARVELGGKRAMGIPFPKMLSLRWVQASVRRFKSLSEGTPTGPRSRRCADGISCRSAKRTARQRESPPVTESRS